ncbi:hypothetical protein OAO01_01675 [Oligoflexia bacterium]|nr:hypothetical protein [Oligoflexia bacterium]
MTTTKSHDIHRDSDSEKLGHRFKEAALRLKSRPDYTASTTSYAPYGCVRERVVIGECTKINGGVYFGSPAHEAVVVDEDYGQLHPAYMQLMVLFARDHKNKKKVEPEILPYIVELVTQKLRFSTEKVSTLHEKMQVEIDQKVALDMYLKEGVGLARHQVLLAAYLLEKLKMRGFIEGCWYIESRYTPDAPHSEKLIYTDANGDLFTFDPIRERARFLDEGVKLCNEDIEQLITTKE